MMRKKTTTLNAKLVAVLLATTSITLLTATAYAQDDVTGENQTELEPIVLEASSYETEGTGSYTTNLISVGDKDTRPLREVPQSTTVLTRERLEDGNYTSLDTAMRETPGVVVLTNDDGRSSLYSRGFEFDSFYLNGLPTPLSSINGTQPDMVMVDHIEILRGPSGLFGGTGEPAGAINMRLKQASDEYKATFNSIFSSWDGKRVEADITGPLEKSGRIRGRLVGAASTKDSWVDGVDNKVGVIYGTVQADLTENTTATLSISHQERNISPFNGLPTLQDGTLLDVSRSTTTGADWNDFQNNVTNYLAELEHRFDDGGHAKISALYSHVDVDFLYAYASAYADASGNIMGGGNNDTRWLARDFREDSLSLDAHVSRPFELLGMENNIIAGIDFRSTDSTLYTANGTINGAQNIYAWNTAIPEPTVTYGAPTDTESRQTGIYGQWRIKPVDRLTLIGGGRFTWYDAENNASDVDVNGEFTPYAGVIFDLTDRLSAYASYTEIFQPQTAMDASGDLLDPRTGRQYEVGLKAELLEEVNASIAYFNLVDENRAVGDPNNPGSSAALGEVHVHGIETEITGELMPNLQATAAYTYTETEFRNTATASGSQFYTPEHMVQLWTKYTLDGRYGALEGAFIGGGVKIFSAFKTVTPSNGFTINAPGYAVVDLQAGYRFNENLSASLTVNNLFDKKYYERVGGNSVFNFYGEPRNIAFKLSATF